MHSIKMKTIQEKPVKFLAVMCDVRYWEDATVNGVEDEDGTLIPCKEGDTWKPVIDLETGEVLGWPKGTVASVHYKVCDAGEYKLLDAEKTEVMSVDGYVPSMLSPGGDGYGDYVIMHIDGDGKIDNWKVDLSHFENSEI